MVKKFSLILLIFLFSFFLYSKEKIIYFALNKNKIYEKYKIIIDFLIDYSEEKIYENNNNIKFLSYFENLETTNIKQIAYYLNLKGAEGFVYIDPKETTNDITINLKLYSNFNNIIKENNFNFSKDIEIDNFLINLEKDLWLNILIEMINNLSIQPIKTTLTKSEIKENIKRDFPYINLGLSLVSAKIYIDSRTTSKIFSFFPINIYLFFFPARYFEFGLFIAFDYDNMIYKYYNYTSKNYEYYQVKFNFIYGIFCGFSLFFDKNHYSLGLLIYNFYNYISENLGWYNSSKSIHYLIPQFCIYQRIDFNILKNINYSIFLNIKTLPLYRLKDNILYSEPFSYDYIFIEFSLIGFSLTI